MPKNIVVCCDGTSNQYNYTHTNVISLYRTLVDDPARQVTFYHPGLGTMGPVGALTKFDNLWTRMAGLAMGRGLQDDICDAYTYLMRVYEDGDRIFLFGFSRGAYTARCIAAVLYLYGLLRKGNEPLVRYAVRMIVDLGKSKGDRSGPLELAEGFKQTFCRSCEIAFVGVWDTVSSVGWFANPLSLPNTADNPAVRVGRHAVAIDERRAFFRQNLWRHDLDLPQHGPEDVKQVWFAGSHSDVGGGYPASQSRLSQIALEWMLGEAIEHGLITHEQRVAEVLGKDGGVRPCIEQEPHESLEGWWKLAEFVPKKHFEWSTGRTGVRMNLFRRRTMPPRSVVHESVFDRGTEYCRRLSPDASKEPWVRL